MDADRWAKLSKHDRREQTRKSREHRHLLTHPLVPPRAYRRAQSSLEKPGRRGRKARARVKRILLKYLGRWQ